ncbi:hypothetical protein TcasGA2_TC012976 [Tribolium castaneum]|uniref:Uncharacterized protein n=1 Tax=Tribolium castaneum TaxID=7070 RepID=D7GXT1_TRICA|nr:hypothetical protein TcasGA2_TC012976 [Tribolium castaneum]
MLYRQIARELLYLIRSLHRQGNYLQRQEDYLHPMLEHLLEQCIILYSKGERRLWMMTRYRDFQNEQILCKWCARQERKVWCMHIHVHNVTLTCTRCTTEILHRANLNCPRRYHLGRQKVRYYSARRVTIFMESDDDRMSKAESGIEE